MNTLAMTGFNRLFGWGLKYNHLTKQIGSIFRQSRLFTLLDSMSIRRLVGGVHIIHQSRELNVKNCYNYLMMENELWM